MKMLDMGRVAACVAIAIVLAGCPCFTPGTWFTLIGDEGDDGAYSIEPTADGGYILAGFVEPTHDEDDNALLLKVDARGMIQWQAEYGDDRDDRAYDAEPTGDGGYVLAGRFGAAGDVDSDGFILKTDAGGVEQWRSLIDSGAADEAVNVVPMADGYLVAAHLDLLGASTAAMIKYDSDGDELWRVDAGGGTNVAQAVVTANGTCALAWWRLVPGEEPGTLTGEAGLLHVDNDGDELWSKVYPFDTAVGIRNLIQTADGGFALAGQNDWLSQDSHLFLAKTDADGELLWHMNLGSEGRDTGHDLIQAPDGGYILAGEVAPPVSHAHMYLIKTDADGDVQWERAYGGTDVDIAYSVANASDGGYVLAGVSESFETEDEVDHSQILLVKTDASGRSPSIQTTFE